MKKGFTLVEILIAMTLVVILAITMTSAFNPILNIDKAGDARRKKDLNRIKTAFEEYYNDKGQFPNSLLTDELNSKTNCDSSTVFSPWLVPWPCDPSGNPYYVVTNNNWFEVYVNLKNRKDTDIPSGWYTQGTFFIGRGDKTSEQYNYCIASTNVDCAKRVPPASSECFIFDGTCKGAPGVRCRDEGDGNCYYQNDCNEGSRIFCCGDWCY